MGANWCSRFYPGNLANARAQWRGDVMAVKYTAKNRPYSGTIAELDPELEAIPKAFDTKADAEAWLQEAPGYIKGEPHAVEVREPRGYLVGGWCSY